MSRNASENEQYGAGWRGTENLAREAIHLLVEPGQEIPGLPSQSSDARRKLCSQGPSLQGLQLSNTRSASFMLEPLGRQQKEAQAEAFCILLI